MKGKELSLKEREKLVPGEAITLTAVLAILAVSLMAVLVYRLFRSGVGSAKLPGGWAFSWK